MTMNQMLNSICFLVFVYSVSQVHSHTLAKVKAENKQDGDLKMEPTEIIIYAGANVTFTCSHPRNVTFLWDFTSKIRSYEVVHGTTFSNVTLEPTYYSKITIFGVTRFMSGEIACSVDDGDSKAVAFLVVNVYSLYDPCDFNEQCSLLVDPKSICNSVCVCAPYARDRKGRCVSLNEISYNRSQEMYRVGLIAVTCIIILIVAMSLWITLKRSCHDQSNGGQNGITQTDGSYQDGLTVETVPDKPPAYDDVIVSEDVLTAPPNIKDALKHCMTAKKLLRQVSAPAGQLLPQQGTDNKVAYDNKTLPKY